MSYRFISHLLWGILSQSPKCTPEPQMHHRKSRSDNWLQINCSNLPNYQYHLTMWTHCWDPVELWDISCIRFMVVLPLGTSQASRSSRFFICKVNKTFLASSGLLWTRIWNKRKCEAFVIPKVPRDDEHEKDHGEAGYTGICWDLALGSEFLNLWCSPVQARNFHLIRGKL